MRFSRFYVIHLGFIICSFYRYTNHGHVTELPCSWGLWLPWNCSCCGNSREITVYRVRTKCCAGAIECGSLRFTARPTLKGDNYAENGQCMDKCYDDYTHYNPNSCTPKPINMKQITQSNKTASCRETCIDFTLSTSKTSTSIASPIYQNSTSTSSLITAQQSTDRQTSMLNSKSSSASSTIRTNINSETPSSSTEYTKESQSKDNSSIIPENKNERTHSDSTGVILGAVLGSLAVLASICAIKNICVFLKGKNTTVHHADDTENKDIAQSQISIRVM